jgi:hypothetical protein
MNQQNRGVSRRIEKREKFSVLRHREIAKREHQSRHGERKHGEKIEHLTAGDLAPYDDIGDGETEDDIDERRQAREAEAVGDGRQP